MANRDMPDIFDLRNAYAKCAVERSWHVDFERAMQIETLRELIIARARKIARIRAKRVQTMVDAKQLACGD